MKDLKPYALNILFRAQHNAMWELAEKAGIMAELNLSIASLEYADNSKEVGIADQNFHDRYGSVQHPRGNHILETLRAGMTLEQEHWVDCGQFDDPNLRKNILEAVATDKADIGFAAYADAESLRDS